jgi:hypothetical protein
MNLVSHSSHDVNTVLGGCLRLIPDSRQIANALIEEAHSTWTKSRLVGQVTYCDLLLRTGPFGNWQHLNGVPIAAEIALDYRQQSLRFCGNIDRAK